MLSHQAGLHCALPEVISPTPGKAEVVGLCDWEDMMKHILSAAPESEGAQKETNFHYWTYGWLLGGFSKAIFNRTLDDYLMTDISTKLSVEGEIYMVLGKIKGF